VDTIYALSSGRLPAAIAVLRISGPQALTAAEALAGVLPPARRARVRTLRDAAGVALDRALVLTFPGPASATGEDLVELHLHGGRAVVAAVERALAAAGLRAARAGEFTRRALEHGRIDLAQAAGLADLLEAETEAQRRAAFAVAEGAVSRAVRGWMDAVADIAARVEAMLDFSDEADVASTAAWSSAPAIAALVSEIDSTLALPPVERLRDGALVVIAGPPNAGKSSLFNALLAREAAIVTPIAGTTRDMLEAAVVRDGVAYRLVDTAGLAVATDDPVERIGIARAREIAAAADLLLWLGQPAAAPEAAICIHARMDAPGRDAVPSGSVGVSVQRPDTVGRLWDEIARLAGERWSGEGALLRQEQRDLVATARDALVMARDAHDVLLVAEHLRVAGRMLAAVLGVDATEAVLERLFGRFCIGK
jgi:tRNA modification GTPase